MENELETVDSLNDETETLDSTNENEGSEEVAEEHDGQDPYTEREKQLYARLKKAEQEKKELLEAQKGTKKPEAPKPKASNSNLSTADIIALTRANIEPEDIDEVVSFANYKKISVTEALKHPAVKATIDANAEIRKSAQAVSVNGGRRAGNAGLSDERLLAMAEKGQLPESEADLNRLAELRLKRK